jgi:heme/copper-type cytochrome/quinol oxidase subunit 1
VYLIFEAFTAKRPAPNNPWKSEELFTSTADTEVVTTLEWLQTSPPSFHTYEQLPYIVMSNKN